MRALISDQSEAVSEVRRHVHTNRRLSIVRVLSTGQVSQLFESAAAALTSPARP
jgi:hypothetical protein